MIKKLRIVVLLLLSVFILLLFYGKYKIKHLNYNEYIKTAEYFVEKVEDLASGYDGVEDLLEDNLVTDVDYLINNSSYVLRVKVKESDFMGTGVINKVNILDVIKGDGVEINQDIMVYDNQCFWHLPGAIYFEGSKPLASNEEYVMFLDKAPNPNMSGSYILSSIKYGSFRLTETPKILEDYGDNHISLLEAREYDYVSLSNDVNVFKMIQKQVYEKFK